MNEVPLLPLPARLFKRDNAGRNIDMYTQLQYGLLSKELQPKLMKLCPDIFWSCPPPSLATLHVSISFLGFSYLMYSYPNGHPLSHDCLWYHAHSLTDFLYEMTMLTAVYSQNRGHDHVTCSMFLQCACIVHRIKYLIAGIWFECTMS